MSAIDRETLPKGAVMAAVGVVVFSLVATAATAYARHHAPAVPEGYPTAPSRVVELSFADMPDGSVSIRDHATGALITALPPGSDGFVRGAMRGLAHDRKVRRIGADAAFRLAEWPDHHLELSDPTDGRSIDLDAFGDINKQAFSRLLPGKDARS
jgi:putative photosynthetic complex assembly protein